MAIHVKSIVALIIIVSAAVGVFLATQQKSTIPVSPQLTPTQLPDDPQAILKFIDATEDPNQRLQAVDKLLQRSPNQQDIITSLIIHPDPDVATRAIRSIQTSTQANSILDSLLNQFTNGNTDVQPGIIRLIENWPSTGTQSPSPTSQSPTPINQSPSISPTISPGPGSPTIPPTSPITQQTTQTKNCPPSNSLIYQKIKDPTISVSIRSSLISFLGPCAPKPDDIDSTIPINRDDLNNLLGSWPFPKAVKSSIKITSPSTGFQTKESSINLQVSINSLLLRSPGGLMGSRTVGPNLYREGHAKVYLDGKLIYTSSKDSGTNPTNTLTIPVVGLEPWSDGSAREYIIKVQLYENNGFTIVPEVKDSITVKVGGERKDPVVVGGYRVGELCTPEGAKKTEYYPISYCESDTKVITLACQIDEDKVKKCENERRKRNKDCSVLCYQSGSESWNSAMDDDPGGVSHGADHICAPAENDCIETCGESTLPPHLAYSYVDPIMECYDACSQERTKCSDECYDRQNSCFDNSEEETKKCIEKSYVWKITDTEDCTKLNVNNPERYKCGPDPYSKTGGVDCILPKPG